MTTQLNAAASSEAPIIAIVGLGPVGTTLGRALVAVRTNYRVLGHDREPERAQAAAAVGAIDRPVWRLFEAVERADLVIVAEPTAEALDTLGTIGPTMAPGALLTTACRVLGPVSEHAAGVLPVGVSFIAGRVALRRGGDGGPTVAGATYCLAPLPTAGDTAVRTMAGLVEAVGARPLFIDPAEHDALAAGVADVPELVASVLMGLVYKSPSGRDLRRLAGQPLYDLATPEGAAAHSAAELVANAEAVVSWLDQLTAALVPLRRALATGDETAVATFLAEAAVARDFLHAAEPPDARDAALAALKGYSPIRGLFFGRRRAHEA